MLSKRAITIDNGGSELRSIINSNGVSKVKDEEKVYDYKGREILTLDKNISVIDRDLFRLKDNVDEYDIIDILKAPNRDYEKMYAINGGYFMYEGADLSMNNQNKKADTLAWYQQVLIMIARDAMQALRTSGIQIGNKDNEEEIEIPIEMVTEYDYTLTTLIPVSEHSGTKDYASIIKDNLEGDYEVEFPAIVDGVNKIKFILTKDSIGVLPEGVVAVTSLRKEIADDEYSLLLDMGHVTTEIAILKGTKLIGNSLDSSPFAGGTLLKLIGSDIRNKGVVASDEMNIEALKTYKFRKGKIDINLGEEINKSKEQFVTNYMRQPILDQIELAGLTTTMIQNVIPIGATLGTINPETKEYDILNKIIEECNLENAELKIVSDNLRNVNIERAADFCDLLAKRG